VAQRRSLVGHVLERQRLEKPQDGASGYSSPVWRGCSSYSKTKHRESQDFGIGIIWINSIQRQPRPFLNSSVIHVLISALDTMKMEALAIKKNIDRRWHGISFCYQPTGKVLQENDKTTETVILRRERRLQNNKHKWQNTPELPRRQKWMDVPGNWRANTSRKPTLLDITLQ